MLRITAVNEVGQSVRLKVEGRIVGEWVSELDHACTVLLAQKKNIILDLSDVRFIDRRGSEVLKKLRGERVHIIGASLLVRTLLEL